MRRAVTLPAITLSADMLGWRAIARTQGPLLVRLDLSHARRVLDKDGNSLPLAESAVVLALAGVEPPEPMTLAVTVLHGVCGHAAIICTELAANRGTSVTNAWPGLARVLLERFDLDAESTRFVEHYFKDSYVDRVHEESFDEVLLGWNNGRPALEGWKSLHSVVIQGDF